MLIILHGRKDAAAEKELIGAPRARRAWRRYCRQAEMRCAHAYRMQPCSPRHEEERFWLYNIDDERVGATRCDGLQPTPKVEQQRHRAAHSASPSFLAILASFRLHMMRGLFIPRLLAKATHADDYFASAMPNDMSIMNTLGDTV